MEVAARDAARHPAQEVEEVDLALGEVLAGERDALEAALAGDEEVLGLAFRGLDAERVGRGVQVQRQLERLAALERAGGRTVAAGLVVDDPERLVPRAPVDAVDAAVELDLEAVAEVQPQRLVARERADRLAPAVRPAEAHLVVVAVERLRVGALAVEPPLEVVEDGGAVDSPEQRVAGLAALPGGGELLLGDRVEPSKLGRTVLQRDAVVHEALEHRV